MWKKVAASNTQKSELVLSPSCHVPEPFKSDSRPRLIGSEKLPLSRKTRKWLDSWLKNFKSTCDIIGIPRFSSSEAYEAFDQEGVELWKILRQELASTYEIFYYSTRLEGLFRHPDFPMVKRIRLDVDYYSWPTWYVDDVGDFDPAQLPISQETLERLNKWQNTFTDTLDHDYPPDSKFPSEEAAKLWSREGTRLWVQLQKELEPDYEVVRRIDYQGKIQPMKLEDWIDAFRGRYQQEDIDNASQPLL